MIVKLNAFILLFYVTISLGWLVKLTDIGMRRLKAQSKKRKTVDLTDSSIVAPANTRRHKIVCQDVKNHVPDYSSISIFCFLAFSLNLRVY